MIQIFKDESDGLIYVLKSYFNAKDVHYNLVLNGAVNWFNSLNELSKHLEIYSYEISWAIDNTNTLNTYDLELILELKNMDELHNLKSLYPELFV